MCVKQISYIFPSVAVQYLQWWATANHGLCQFFPAVCSLFSFNDDVPMICSMQRLSLHSPFSIIIICRNINYIHAKFFGSKGFVLIETPSVSASYKCIMLICCRTFCKWWVFSDDPCSSNADHVLYSCSPHPATGRPNTGIPWSFPDVHLAQSKECG